MSPDPFFFGLAHPRLSRGPAFLPNPLTFGQGLRLGAEAPFFEFSPVFFFGTALFFIATPFAVFAALASFVFALGSPGR